MAASFAGRDQCRARHARRQNLKKKADVGRLRGASRRNHPCRAGKTLRFETESVGEPLLILSSGFRVKRFPNCGSAHRAQDGLLELKARHGFAADEVAAIHVRAPVTHLNNLMYTRPEDPLQAKFSVEYGLACCLVTRLRPWATSRRAVARPGCGRSTPASTATGRQGRMGVDRGLSRAERWRASDEVAMPMGSLAAPFRSGLLANMKAASPASRQN